MPHVRNTASGYVTASSAADERFALLFRWLRFGYVDACGGLPFRPEYQAAPQLCQSNYETGRLVAATIRKAGLPTPAWQAGSGLPDSVNRAFIAAVEQCGRPEPSIAPLPPDPALEFEVRLPGPGRRWKSRAGRR